MEESNQVTLPKALKHWINSVKTTRCTLYNELSDLSDGYCICELVQHIFQTAVNFEDTKTPAGLIQSALNVIADNIGWNSIPPEFKQRNAAYRLAQGEPMFMCVFIQYLHDLSVKLPQGMSGDVDTDVENALNELRTAASAAEEAWEEPRYLSEQPLSYAEYIALAEGENDSLEGEDELNVVSSSEIRRQRAMGVHKNNKIARPSPASHVRTRTNSNSDNSSSRHTTPPLRFTNSSSSQQSSLQHSTQSQQSQAEILAAAHAATQQRLLLHAKRTAQKATADTTGSSSSSAGGTGSGGAKAKLSLSAPASISVRAGQGLTVGSSMIDPKYQPGGKRIFTETAPEPEPEEPSSSSESEDSIRPIYDPHYTGQKGRGGFGHQQQRHPSMRMPHSKSISPVGRRHLHCQLRDSVHPPVVYRNRSVSPNEARVLRANNQYQQPYRVDVNNMHNAAGYSSAEERIIRHKRLSTENAAYDQQLPHSKQNVHFGTSEIRKKQSKAVLGVFKRNDLQPSSSSKKPGRKDTAIDIDAVITTERKNIILTWIQQHLGICIDTHVNATTSAQYNRSVGKNVVSPDSIAVVPKSEKHTDKGTHSGKKGPQKSPDGEIDKENYYFFPETEDALFIPSRSSNSYGTYSIATYLGKITGGAAAYTANVADQVVAQQQQHQQHQRESVVLQIPEDLEGAAAAAAGSVVASAGKFTAPPYVKAPTTSIGFLNDPWVGGLLLSEIVAALSVENRALIKQVDNFDRFGRLVLPPKLIICGTEYTVKSRAQAKHNIQLCMDLLASSVPGFPTLDYSAEDIISGNVSLWKLLDAVHESVKHTYRHSSAGRGRGRGRCRSSSPGSRGPSREVIRSISAPPAPDRKAGSSSSAGAANVVTFADQQSHEPRSRDNIPRPSSPPSRLRSAGAPASNSAQKGSGSNFPSGRSRSVSPASSSRIPTGASAQAAAAAVVPANPMLELRRQEQDHEREKARLYAQRKRMQQREGGGNSGNSAQPTSSEKGWVSTTTVEQRPRSSSAPRRTSVVGAATTSTGAAVAGVNAPGTAAGSSSTSQAPGGAPAVSGSSSSSSSGVSKSWHPPKLTATEVEAAQNCYLPTVSVFQQRSIRDWLIKAFGIHLLDEECGFYNNGDAGAAGVAPVSDALSGGAVEGNNAARKFDPKFETVPAHAPAPLPLQDDRVRNGVLLGQLLLRLEPNAAIHAHIPRLLHKHPRSLELSLENLERVLWVFKLRRAPPIPLQYLCQPEEILKGHDKVIWGLLWELMQAYPYVAIQEKASTSNTASSHPAGIVVANKEHLIPQPGHGRLKTPIRVGLNKLFSSPPSKPESRRSSLGLKGAEAKHNVPRYMRYNYVDPHLEHPVEAHTLPYSDSQRHQLDLSLLNWLDETRLLGEIIGSLSKPVTILALESYCKDGTLFCLVLEKVLKLTFVKDWHRSPSTYVECMSNLKNCLDLLRKCQNMKSRYLYAGAEEDICRGKWDCILGLLEDMHRYSDGVHPHAQIFSTIDANGRTVEQGALPGAGAAAFNFTTVDAPYLGKFGTRVVVDDYSPTSCGIRDDGNDTAVGGSARGTSVGSTHVGAAAGAARTSTVPPQQSNLMHDVAYAFEPQLNILPEPSPPPPPPRTKTRSLAEQMRPLPVETTPPGKAAGAHRTGDLFPSNAVAGGNVTTMLSAVDTSPDSVGSTVAPTTSAAAPAFKGGAGNRHSSGIPTPIRSKRPPMHPLPATSDSSALPAWVESSLKDAAAGGGRDRNDGKGRTNNGGGGGGGNQDQETSRLSQALSFPDSDTEQQQQEHIQRQRQTHSPCKSSSGNSRGRAGPSRASPVRTSPTPQRPHRTATNTTTASTTTTPGANFSMMSEYEADSLGGDSSSTSSQSSPQSAKSPAGERSPPLDPIKMRRLAKWFDELGIHVPRKNERSFATRHAFSDGVILCTLLQKLERSGAIPGTFPAPRTHSERVQNVRRCLELLATRHKSIPLRELSCEEDVLEGNLKRTVELLFIIKKAYATHRR